MKVDCHVDPAIETEHADVWVKKMTPELSALLQELSSQDQILWCYREDEMRPVRLDDIFVIQTTDRGLDVSTRNEHFLCRRQLSAVREMLTDDFAEASRSAMINIRHIDHLILLDNGAIDLIMKNQQRIPIARRKLHILKERLGI
jgi:DNA-binding LytR/AlgR family response regulator